MISVTDTGALHFAPLMFHNPELLIFFLTYQFDSKHIFSQKTKGKNAMNVEMGISKYCDVPLFSFVLVSGCFPAGSSSCSP